MTKLYIEISGQINESSLKQREKNYNTEKLKEELKQQVVRFNSDQILAFDCITYASNTGNCGKFNFNTIAGFSV